MPPPLPVFWLVSAWRLCALLFQPMQWPSAIGMGSGWEVFGKIGCHVLLAKSLDWLLGCQDA